MQQLTIELETVTPLFLGGAEPRDSPPELRAASVRGALRYWLRTLLGGVMGDDDKGIKAVKESEARVFGSMKQALGGASAIVLRLPPPSPDQIEIIDVPAPRMGQTDRSYLFYGLEQRYKNRSGQWRLKYRQSVRPNIVFPLKLGQRLGVQADEQYIWACASLWLLTHLGSLGARSRRGAGSVQVQRNPNSNWPSQKLPSLAIRSSTPAELVGELEEGIHQIWRAVGQPAIRLSPPTGFDILHPKACRIRVLDSTQGSWEDALDTMAVHLQKWRSRKPKSDYQGVKNALLSSTKPKTVARAAFGLPLPFFFSSRFKQLADTGMPRHEARDLASVTVVPADEHLDRRASPLIVRVVRLAGGRKYALVLTFFNAEFLPQQRNKIAVKPKTKGAIVCDPPDYSFVIDFLDSLPGTEVKL